MGIFSSLLKMASAETISSGLKNTLSYGQASLVKNNFTGLGLNLGLNLVVPTAITLLGHSDHKGREIVQNTGLFLLTAGMGPARAFAAQAGLQLASKTGDAIRLVQSTNRSALESRSMAIVPFSYSTMPMDMALSSMQYARARTGNAYGIVGNEAAFLASRSFSR
jgi:hypothetical protein